VTFSNVKTAQGAVEVRSALGGKTTVPTRFTASTVAGAPPAPPPAPTGTTSPTNLPPVALDDTASTIVKTALVVPVAANDSDPDSTLDLNSITVVTPPAHGTIGLIGPAGITYTPAAGFANGSDTFTYTIADDQGARSNVATVSVTIQPEVIAPTLDQFTRSKSDWRVRGTSNATASNTITAYLVHGTTRTLIGSAAVDPLGAYDLRSAKGSTVVPVSGDTITLESTKGTVVTDIVITIK
jgi:hypothetical protein